MKCLIKQRKSQKGRSGNPFGRPKGIRNKATVLAEALLQTEIEAVFAQKYTRHGMSLLKDLTWYFQEAGLEAKRKLLGSIFPAKLTFQNGKYRTDGLNPSLAIILQNTNNLEK